MSDNATVPATRPRSSAIPTPSDVGSAMSSGWSRRHANEPAAPLAVGPYAPLIHSAGRDAKPQAWTVLSRRLNHHLLSCNLSGNLTLTVEDRTWQIGPGDTYLVPPGALVHHVCPQGNHPHWLHFDLVRAAVCDRQLAADADRTRTPSAPPTMRQPALPVVIPAELRDLFRRAVPEIARTWLLGDDFSVMRASHRLAGLLIELATWTHRSQDADQGWEGRLSRAEAQARTQLEQGFDVSDLARATGCSRARLHELFLEHRGTTPGYFLREARLERAVELMSDQTQSIEAIAKSVGYADATGFGRAFRKRFGMTPRRWRQQSV